MITVLSGSVIILAQMLIYDLTTLTDGELIVVQSILSSVGWANTHPGGGHIPTLGVGNCPPWGWVIAHPWAGKIINRTCKLKFGQ